MKVNDLLENNDWDNNQEDTTQYLFKKQLAACEAFEMEARKLRKSYPDQIGHLWSRRLWRSTSVGKETGADIDLQTVLTSYPSIQTALREFPTLKAKFDNMVQAKEKYEETGGMFGGMYPTLDW